MASLTKNLTPKKITSNFIHNVSKPQAEPVSLQVVWNRCLPSDLLIGMELLLLCSLYVVAGILGLQPLIVSLLVAGVWHQPTLRLYARNQVELQKH